MSEARDEDTIQPADENEQDGRYAGPDPEEDEKGDGSDEDQGT